MAVSNVHTQMETILAESVQNVTLYLVLSWDILDWWFTYSIVHKTKTTPCKCLHTVPMIFNMVCVCFLLCDGCSWVFCLFWIVTWQKKNPADSSVFQHLLQIWTLSSGDRMIVRSFFLLWGWLRDSNTTIKIGFLTDAPEGNTMLYKKINKHDEDVKMFLFCWTNIVLHLLLPFGNNRKCLYASRKTN